MIYNSDIKGFLDLFGTKKLTIFGVLSGVPFTGTDGRLNGVNAVLEVATGRVDLPKVSKYVVELSQGSRSHLYQ